MSFPCTLTVPCLVVAFSLITAFPEVLASGNVTLESVIIFRTHEWLGKPSVYFMCQGGSKVYLPDLVNKNYQYTFIGEESWQPLTSLEESKCKRCGLYEEDIFKPDDIFDEWELCPIHFKGGRYNHFKEREFNMTLLCSHCYPSDSDHPDESDENKHHEDKGHTKRPFMMMLVGFVGVIVLVVGYVGFKFWQRKKREEQQARFIKLFEEDDEGLKCRAGYWAAQHSSVPLWSRRSKEFKSLLK